MAQLCGRMGDYERAVALARRVFAIRNEYIVENHTDYALALINLGTALDDLGRNDETMALYRQSADLTRRQLGPEHPFYAQCLNSLAGAYIDAGDLAAAKPLYEEALAIRRKVLGEQHPLVVQSLNNLAFLHVRFGEFEEGARLFEQALEFVRDGLGRNHPLFAVALANLAAVYEFQGDAEKASPLLAEAWEAASRKLGAAAAASAEQQQLLYGQSVRHLLDSYLSHLVRAGDQAETAYGVELAWKGATLARQRAARLVNSPELAPVFTELQSVVRQWTAAAKAAADGDPKFVKFYGELAARREALEADLSAKSGAYADAVKDVSAGDVASALPEDAALVDYFEYTYSEPSKTENGILTRERSLLAFVIRKGRGVTMVNLGPMEPIEAAIDAWRATYGQSADAQAAAGFLRTRLWAPLSDAIGDAPLVVISPDGALGKLPFCALPGKAAGTYLIEDAAVALVPVPRLIPTLAAAEDASPADRELLLVGGVDYDRRRGEEAPVATETDPLTLAAVRGATATTSRGLQWTALPGTASEAEAIGALFKAQGGDVAVLDGATATEEAFRELAQSSQILHVATHGFFAPEGRRSALDVEEPEDGASLDGFQVSEELGHVGGFPPGLLSGLVLAGANDPPELPEDAAAFAALPEDGILTAEELAFLPLTKVRLAVLSACETGLGEVAGGEGLLGIQRAFQISGVRTTIASLWKVDDAMTQRLMTAFYRNVLEGGQSHLEALRSAQLEMLRDLRDPERREALLGETLRGVDSPADATAMDRGAPYFWAAFTLSGDWR
jgi:CHAT domain-containing protein